jgi:hypothetical protein
MVPSKVLFDIAAIIIVGFMAAQQFREQRMKVSRLWILPALALLFTYTGIQNDFFDTGASPAIIGGAFVVGLIIGGIRGATTKLKVDTTSQTVTVQGTLVSVTLWLGLLSLKGVADFILSATGAANSTPGLTATLITAALLAFSLGAVIATQVYFYWRYALTVPPSGV